MGTNIGGWLAGALEDPTVLDMCPDATELLILVLSVLFCLLRELYQLFLYRPLQLRRIMPQIMCYYTILVQSYSKFKNKNKVI